jgi:hypothetical protein
MAGAAPGMACSPPAAEGQAARVATSRAEAATKPDVAGAFAGTSAELGVRER